MSKDKIPPRKTSAKKTENEQQKPNKKRVDRFVSSDPKNPFG